MDERRDDRIDGRASDLERRVDETLAALDRARPCHASPGFAHRVMAAIDALAAEGGDGETLLAAVFPRRFAWAMVGLLALVDGGALAVTAHAAARERAAAAATASADWLGSSRESILDDVLAGPAAKGAK